MDDGRNAAAYSDMLDEALERISRLREALSKISDFDEHDGLAAARMTADAALEADDASA